MPGAAGRYALRRAARFGDGWMPNGSDPQKLGGAITELRELFAAAAKPAPEVIALTSLPLEEPDEATERVRALAEVGVTAVVHASRYADSSAFARNAEALAVRIRPAVARA